MTDALSPTPATGEARRGPAFPVSGASKNPFDLAPAQSRLAVILGLCASVIIYLLILWALNANLVRAVERADVLSQVLDSSPLYVSPIDSKPTHDTGTKKPKEVNDLAVLTWLRHFGLVSRDAEYSSVMEDERLSLVIKALRHGGPGNPTELRALKAPTVTTLAATSASLLNNSGNSQNNNNNDAIAATIVSRIAGLREGCTLTSLGQTVSPGCIHYFFPAPNSPAREILKLAYEKATLYDENSNNSLKDLKSIRDITTARATRPQIADEKLQALQDFQLGVLAAIESDSGVAKARRNLAVFRGLEQLAILAIALISALFLLLRQINLRWHRAAVMSLSGKIDALPHLGQPHQSGQMTEKIQIQTRIRNYGTLHRSFAGESAHSPIAADVLREAIDDLKLRLMGEHSEGQTDRVIENTLTKQELSRTMLAWCLTTLPALGFLGTVHGILDALSNVGGLGQGDASTRMATLISVSGSLGLAFATTLLALLFMMILSFFDTRQSLRERSLVVEFRDELEKKVLA